MDFVFDVLWAFFVVVSLFFEAASNVFVLLLFLEISDSNEVILSDSLLEEWFWILEDDSFLVTVSVIFEWFLLCYPYHLLMALDFLYTCHRIYL